MNFTYGKALCNANILRTAYTHYGLEQQWVARIQEQTNDRRQIIQQKVWRDPWFLLTDFGDGDDDDF